MAYKLKRDAVDSKVYHILAPESNEPYDYVLYSQLEYDTWERTPVPVHKKKFYKRAGVTLYDKLFASSGAKRCLTLDKSDYVIYPNNDCVLSVGAFTEDDKYVEHITQKKSAELKMLSRIPYIRIPAEMYTDHYLSVRKTIISLLAAHPLPTAEDVQDIFQYLESPYPDANILIGLQLCLTLNFTNNLDLLSYLVSLVDLKCSAPMPIYKVFQQLQLDRIQGYSELTDSSLLLAHDAVFPLEQSFLNGLKERLETALSSMLAVGTTVVISLDSQRFPEIKCESKMLIS